MAIIVVAMVFVLTSGMALAQQKGPGQAKEHEKHHPAQQGQQPQQPI